MILVDTSVWVAALRDAESPEAEALRSLLDDDRAVLAWPVRIEILSGASGREQQRLRRLLAALPCWLPRARTWTTMEGWVQQAASAGERFAVGDLLIGAVAAENGAAVWSLDGDFHRLATLGLVGLFTPAAR